MAAFHDRGGDALAPSAASLLWQVNKRASRALDFVQCTMEVRQEPFREASADSAGEQETVRTLVTNKQRAEVFAAAFWRGVAADDKLLRSRQFHFDPGAPASTGLVERIRSFGDQALEAELPRCLEKLFF